MKIITQISKLIDVKSITTLALVFVLCYSTIMGSPTSDLFDSAVMLVLGFFFGKVSTKDSSTPVETTKEEKNQTTVNIHG